jgi:hypothetical protein
VTADRAPSKRDVAIDAALGAVSYVIGLVVVILLSTAAPETAAFVAGVIAFVIAYFCLYFALLRHAPPFGWRPWRYSIPNAIGLLAATSIWWTRPGVIAGFALGAAFLILGQTVSQLWWSSAATPPGSEAT